MLVTAQMLRDKGGSCEQVEIFEQQWPNGVKVGIRAANKAVKLGLDLHWFARMFLPAAAWAEYEKLTAAAWAEYKKATAAAWTTAAWAECEKATAAALVTAIAKARWL